MLPDALRRDLDRYVSALDCRFGADLVSVVLFGSGARGEARAESDVDVLIVVRGLPRKRFERYRGLRAVADQVSREFGEAISAILLTPEEAQHVNPYYLGMLSGHMILRDEGGFFAGVLDRLRRRLVELGSRRYVDEDGYEYWDLKPDWKPGDIVTLWPRIGLRETIFTRRGATDRPRERCDSWASTPRSGTMSTASPASSSTASPANGAGRTRGGAEPTGGRPRARVLRERSEEIPASELFGEDDARRAMTVVDRLLDLYARLLGERP